MADLGVDHLFCLHRAAGRMWPASVLSLRDVVKALAGPEYLKNQGMHARRVPRQWIYSDNDMGYRTNAEKIHAADLTGLIVLSDWTRYDTCTNEGIILV